MSTLEPYKGDRLTIAEHEVMRLVCRGLDNREIAQARGTSRGTAKAQMTAILRKLGARNRTHAAAIYAGERSEARIYQDAEKHILRRLRRVGK